MIKLFYGAYANIRNASWQCLIDYGIKSLPIDIIDVAKKSNIKVIKDSDINILKKEERGASILCNGNWYIVYKDSNSYETKRFTIAHELGHIFLGHPIKSGYFAKTVSKNKDSYEAQADSFATRFLSPACVLWGLGLHTAAEIADYCHIAKPEASVRAARMRELYKRNLFLTHPLEKSVYENFEDYIKNNRNLLS